MALTLKNRVALHYVLATAALVAAAYLVVFGVVRQRVVDDLDRGLQLQAAKHLSELYVAGDALRFAHKGEWEEQEHRQVDVAPVFVQVNDTRGRLMDRSPNLKADQLLFHLTGGQRVVDAALRGRAIRQLQQPIVQQGQVRGYLLVAVPTESAKHVLDSLCSVLLLSFPLVLLALYGSAQWLAGRSIAPIVQITATTNRITRDNLAARIGLPPRPDELHTLATAINGLLGRVEQAVEREKQFTADASHELRTPLAVLKGTLEVLVRKPRTPQEYVASIQLGIGEIDRLTHLVDQLLLMARFENHAKGLNRQELSVLSAVHDVLYRHRADLEAKRIRVDVEDGVPTTVPADPYLLDLILDNLVSNAVKYSPAGSSITVSLTPGGGRLRCAIRDQGIGIRPEDQSRIFDPLYRSDALQHKHIGGTGLGLSIVAKACALLGIELAVESELGRGTTFTLVFPVA